MENHKKLIIAHRGAHKQAPENSLEAFQAAISLGVDMIELDVRRTRDKVMVIHHDPDVQGQNIASMDWAQVKALKPSIPTLEATLKLTSGKIKLDIELKEAGYEKEAVDLILKYFQPADFIISSFLEKVGRAVKRLYPGISFAMLIGDKKFADFIVGIKMILNLPPIGTFEGVAVYWKLWNFGWLNLSSLRNKESYVWTANEPEMMAKMLQDIRVTGIITNEPELALKLRNHGNTK